MPLTQQVEDQALSLLEALLREDSSNPPGNEKGCAEILARALSEAGYQPQLLEKAPNRTNLVVRRKGDGTGGAPLLLTAHLDVVPADAKGWKHPPFGAVQDAGWLHGRGAVDMKNHAAACAALMCHLARESTPLKRDVIFAAVADEEAGSSLGAQFLVEEHPELVRAEWAIGELGGFTLRTGGKRLYPIQVAHRGAAWLLMRATGTPGHGSIPREDSSVMRLGRAVLRIGNGRLPVHPTEPVRQMLAAFGAARGFPASLALSLLTRPAVADWALHSLIADEQVRRSFNAVLRNTAAVTVLRAGEAINVLPPTAEARVDGRLVPGQKTADLLRELAELVDDEKVTFEVLREIAPVSSPVDSPLYRELAAAVGEMDPGGIPFPFVTPGFTDGSAFARLGTHFYGFAPMVLPEEPAVPFAELFHGKDERIPVEGFKAGLRALWRVVTRFAG